MMMIDAKVKLKSPCNSPMSIKAIMVKSQIAGNKFDASNLLQTGAVAIDGVAVTDGSRMIDCGSSFSLTVGKRRRIDVTIVSMEPER